MKKFKLFSIVVLVLGLFLVGCSRDSNDAPAQGMMESVSGAAQPAVPSPSPPAPAPQATAESPMQAMASSAQVELPPAIEADFSSDFGGDFELTIGDASSLQRMIIRSADIGLRTYDFEDTVTGIERIMTTRGGFIESSGQWMVEIDNQLLWQANFTLRVPVGLFDQVNRELVALAQVRQFSTASEDVTMEFHDLASRLVIREEEMRRVEVMLAAATYLPDIIRLEAQLTNLRLAVDAYQRRMTEIDQLAGFSTIRLTIEEATPAEEPEDENEEEDEEEYYYPIPYDDGFGTRIAGAFSASINFCITVLTYLAMFFAAVGLPLVLIASIGFVAYVIVKRVTKFRLK